MSGTAAPKPLDEFLASVIAGAVSFRDKHPDIPVTCSVTLGSRLWKTNVRALQLPDGYVLPIDDEGEGVTFMSMTDDRPDMPLTDELLWFHPTRDDEDDDDWDDEP